MFVRKKQSSINSNISVQLIESFRDDGKVRHRIVKHIGTAKDDDQLEKLLKLGQELKKLYKSGTPESTIKAQLELGLKKITEPGNNILHCKKISSKITGIHDIYGSVLKDFNLSKIFGNDNYYKIFCDIIMAKIAKPSSKRMAVQTLEEDFGIKHKLHTVYRVMDKLDPSKIQLIQDNIATYNKKLIGGNITVLFYDVTTIYFESFTSDELKNLGYSKDLKFNQPQIVLTLLVTEQGLPLGYQLLPGSTYEGNTLISAIDAWQKNYPDSKFVLVADSGMLNKTNLSVLDSRGISYIVCARIKNLPKATKEELLAFKEAESKHKDFFYALEFSTRKLILSYKVNRASKDKHDRDKAIEKLSYKLKQSKKPEALISNYGYKRYIDVDGSSNVTINEKRITESERWDGLHGLITNIKDISPEKAYHYYKDLWQVEDAFRINKSDLKIRPIFHWTEKRIQAHILMSYVSYSCYKAVEYIVNKYNDHNICHRQIKNLLMKVGINIHKDKFSDKHYAIPEPTTDEIRKIYQIFAQELEEEAYYYNLPTAC